METSLPESSEPITGSILVVGTWNAAAVMQIFIGRANYADVGGW